MNTQIKKFDFHDLMIFLLTTSIFSPNSMSVTCLVEELYKQLFMKVQENFWHMEKMLYFLAFGSFIDQ